MYQSSIDILSRAITHTITSCEFEFMILIVQYERQSIYNYKYKMGSLLSIIGTIIGLIVLGVIGVIIYFVYEAIASAPTTSCTTYAHTSAALGTENGPGCAAGQDYYGGVCYNDYWTAEGGTKTAICTVDYGPYGGVFTECGIGIFDLNQGDTCPASLSPQLGTGWHKTAVCTCQYKGIVTASKYCQSAGIAQTCKPGWDYYGSVCYQDPCPDGYYRSAICTCAKK